MASFVNNPQTETIATCERVAHGQNNVLHVPTHSGSIFMVTVQAQMHTDINYHYPIVTYDLMHVCDHNRCAKLDIQN